MQPMQGSVDDDCFWEREATGDNKSALLHWGLDKMADILQTEFQDAFFKSKISCLTEFSLKRVSNGSFDNMSVLF